MKGLLLLKVTRMTDAQLYREIYVDPLAETLNRKAFNSDRCAFKAIADLDSLKYVNDTYGYREGDRFIKCMADKLLRAFDSNNVYRLHGDEFAVTADSKSELEEGLKRLQSTFPYFSYGIAPDLDKADKRLKQDKKTRELSGARAKRGQTPAWGRTVAQVGLF